MSAAPKRLLTPEQYLAQERRAEFRSEYLRGEVFAMTGTSFEHCLIKDNFARKAGNQLEETACRVITSDMRVKITKTGLYSYPDLVIVCDEPQFEDATFDTLLNPRVIVEVHSDSTEKYDRGRNFAHYRQIPSLQEYVRVAQDQAVIERFVRQSDESWLLTAFADLGQVFELTSVPVRLALAEVYRGVTFPELEGQ